MVVFFFFAAGLVIFFDIGILKSDSLGIADFQMERYCFLFETYRNFIRHNQYVRHL
jgi:hypothetical protein